MAIEPIVIFGGNQFTSQEVTELLALIATGLPVYNEIVLGSGISWNLLTTPVSGSVQLYGEGQRLIPGAGNDYTISGTSITTVNSWSTGALLADYHK